MQRALFILFLIFLFQTSCKKEKAPETSGTVTIDNTRTLGQTYYVYGFLFSEGKKASTIENPPPDITVDSDGTNILFQANNLKNSFFNFGTYPDEAAAVAAFNGLTSASVPSGDWEGLASPLAASQIWIYRSGTDHYAKIRIVSVLSEMRAGNLYAECTFEWAYQPDGTLTFPGK